MKIYVTVKQAGKRKAYLTKQEMVLHHVPRSLRDLITQIVRINVEAYNQKAKDGLLVQYLLPEELDDQAETGKITFGERRNEKLADVHTAIDTALLAFQDGLFRVFSDENEITDLDEPLELRDESVLTFIRFTMLAGRERTESRFTCAGQPCSKCGICRHKPLHLGDGNGKDVDHCTLFAANSGRGSGYSYFRGRTWYRLTQGREKRESPQEHSAKVEE